MKLPRLLNFFLIIYHFYALSSGGIIDVDLVRDLRINYQSSSVILVFNSNSFSKLKPFRYFIKYDLIKTK